MNVEVQPMQFAIAGHDIVCKSLHSIENGEKIHHHNDYIQSDQLNGITLQHLNESNNNRVVQEKHISDHVHPAAAAAAAATSAANTENSDNSNLSRTAEQTTKTSSTQSQQPKAHNCNIEYTDESIRNSSSNGNNTCTNDRAVIDVKKTTHTSADLKVTTTAPSAQLSYAKPTNNDGNENNDEESNHQKKQKLSHKIVVLLRRSKPIALVVINSVLAVSIVISVCTTMGWDYTVPAIIFGVAAVVASSGLWYWLYIAAVTAPRDIRALYRYIKLLSLVRRCQRKNVAICDLFHHYVAKHPQKPCIIFEGNEWTFRDVNDFSNRIGNLFQQQGYKKGDVVGLFMENRPEFVATWLGLSKIGVIVPLINTNQRQASLIHSVEIAKCTALIYGESLATAVTEVKDRLAAITLYQYNDDNRTDVPEKSIKNLNEFLERAPKTDVILNSSSSGGDTHHNQLLYIYTSGTTGLPKAAVITHSRYIFIAAGIHYMAAFQPDDIFYTPLPLYHTAGGVMSIGQALLFGSTVVIRKKFSASGYFPDCKKYKCTVAQYIGEMCRYVLATPPNEADSSHNLRIIFGNGLRPQIWPQFVSRFKIPHVSEFYGATEGNANIVNINNVVGAIGFVSRIIPSVYPISIIKADPSTGEPIRGENGLCQHCNPHEPGVFVGKIMPGNPSRAFLGYVDKKASSKKVVTDVFKKGDSAFLSGDLLVSDEYGNLYFKDRTGDTFRWKGENVSTSEVEAQVSNVAGYRDTVVYGVEIPNTEGRAGMAAILDVDQSVDLDALATGLKSVLPAYARPQFIRLLSKVDMTGTFKLKKLDLQKEGFDPSKISDSLYYMSAGGKYCRLDKAVYEQIVNGAVRF